MAQTKIVVTDTGDGLLPAALQTMRDAGHEVVIAPEVNPADRVAVAADADALFVIRQRLHREELSRLRKCRVMVRMGVGYDNIDADAARDLGIAVCNVPGYCTNEVADHAFAMATALLRHLPFLDRRLRAGDFLPPLPYAIPAYETLTFGAYGFGRIGKAVLRRAAASLFTTIANDPYVPDDAFDAAGVRRVSLEELLAQSDVLSLHAPLTDETRHVLNESALARMKPGAIVVNTARGSLIDTPALAEVLTRGAIAAAGIDVFEVEPLRADDPILRCPNVLISPHQAWRSDQSAAKLQFLTAQVLIDALRGDVMTSCVNGFTILEGI